MKMTGNSRMQSLISLIALSLGLCSVFPVSANNTFPFPDSLPFLAGSSPFLLDSSGKVFSEIETLGRHWTMDINDAGQVVGWSITAGYMHAFITGPNGVGMTDLNSNSLTDVPSGFVVISAVGINNAGQIIPLVETIPPIPETPSYTRMLAGLGLIGFVAWRQKPGSRIQY